MSGKRNTITAVFLFVLIVGALIAWGRMGGSEAETQATGTITTNNPVSMEQADIIVKTNRGDVGIDLFLEQAPITAGNFLKLSQEGFYDGTKIHRVIKDFMVQGGDPLSKDDAQKALWGTGGSDPIQDEFVEGLSNVRGTLSMANTGQPNSGSSQFFINVADNTFLDFDKAPLTSKHPVFGRVVSGMDVVDLIAAASTDPGDRPLESVVIEKVEVVQAN